MNASPAERTPHWPVWTVLAFVALWPTGAPAEAVLALGALATLIALPLRRLPLAPAAMRLATVFFLAYWLPELLSAVDALDAKRAWREAAADLRYLPFLWLVAAAVGTEASRRRLGFGLTAIVVAWCADALLQATTGWSLGGASDGARLTGIFGADNPKLGLVLAALAAFPLRWAQSRFGLPGWAVVALALGVVIGLAGARAAWLMLGLVLLLTGWRALGGGRRAVLVLLAGTLALGALGLVVSDRLADRLERTAAALSGDAAGLDTALSGRLPIWRAALAIAADHPLNGVGIRGFRVAWPDYVDAGAPQAWGEGGALHTHQWLLEVLAETGLLGLLCWLAGIAAALRAWSVADPVLRARAATPAIALIAVLFPLNTHLAVYSTFWGGVVLLLAGLYAGAIAARGGPPRA